MGEPDPTVSVIMPAYNASATLRAAARSVLAQSFRRLELIIVDDNSIDTTFDIAIELARNESRVRVHRLDRNSGSPALPRNVATCHARGRYIAFLDADDLWRSDKLELQLEAMAGAKAAFSCTGYEVVDADGKPAGAFTPPAHAHYGDLLKRNSIGCLTAMYDSQMLGKRSFPPCGHEDYALWLKILREGQTVLGLPEPLATYRLGAASVSSNKPAMARYFWHIYRNEEGFRAVAAALMTARYALLNAGKYGR